MHRSSRERYRANQVSRATLNRELPVPQVSPLCCRPSIPPKSTNRSLETRASRVVTGVNPEILRFYATIFPQKFQIPRHPGNSVFNDTHRSRSRYSTMRVGENVISVSDDIFPRFRR